MVSTNTESRLLTHNATFILFSLLYLMRMEFIICERPAQKIRVSGLMGDYKLAIDGLRDGKESLDPRNAVFCDRDLKSDLSDTISVPRRINLANVSRLIALADGISSELTFFDCHLATLLRRAVEKTSDVFSLAHPSPSIDLARFSSDISIQTVSRAIGTLPDRPGRQASRRLKTETECSLSQELFEQIYTIEYPAGEVCAGMCLRFQKDLPIDLDLVLAQQTYEEGRHAGLVLHILNSIAGSSTGFEPCFEIWDKFQKGTSLPECLCIEHFIGEGYALGSDYMAAQRHRDAGNIELACVYDSLQADEIHHVRNGISWFRKLAGCEAQRIVEKLESQLAVSPPPAPWFNENLKRLVGFSDNEIERQKILRDKRNQE